MAKTLLLADDSVTIQKVVAISFAGEDVILITVDNGEDAIAKARETRPDAILADVIMPGKTGYEVCEAIQADPALQHIPVLLLTGTFEAFDEERARRCGAAGHVAKPFEAKTLVERVLQLFAQAPAPTKPPVPAPQADASLLDSGPRASGESFDFFDDDLGDLTPAEPGLVEAAAGSGPADLETAEDAFAFGDPDSAALEPEAPAVPTPVPEALSSSAPDRTVAILPEDEEGDLASDTGALAELDVSLEPPSPEPSAESLLGEELAAPAEATPALDEDVFDFDIGSAPTAAIGQDSPAPVEREDLAQASVLDPKGSSGFDVSSSDLGDPLPAEPLAPPPTGVDSPEAPAPGTPLEAPADAGAPEPAAFFAEPADPVFDVAVEETPPEPAVPAVELDESSLDDLAPPVPAEPEGPSPVAAATHDTAALAGVALAEITPQLKEQLHDTLEKLAWETFGDVTEQIVRQALERVERIAWEVIPQMAETLIREEIRRMKGETER